MNDKGEYNSAETEINKKDTAKKILPKKYYIMDEESGNVLYETSTPYKKN